MRLALLLVAGCGRFELAELSDTSPRSDIVAQTSALGIVHGGY